jgi:AsmA protein
LTLKGSFGVPPSPSGRISVPFDLVAQTISRGRKAGTSGSMALKGKLALDNFQFAGLDAAAAVRTPALASLDPILGRSLPALTDVRFDGRVVIPAKAGPVRFVGARLQTQEGDVSGDGTIERGADLALTAKLHADRIDLDKVLGLAGIGSAAVSEHPAGSVIPDMSLPWAALRGPTLDISGSVGALTYQGEAFQNLDFALHLKGGRISLGELNVPLPGGPLAISVTADASTDPGAATFAMQAPTLPLALIARTAGLSDPVQGLARIEVQLRGAGRSAHELAASLEGPFSVTVLGGTLSNAAFLKLVSGSLDALGIAVPAQGETTLHCLGLGRVLN